MKTLCWLVFLCSGTILGQNVVAFSNGAACCRIVWSDGNKYFVIQDANVTIMASGPSNYSARLHSVYLQIRQDGDSDIEVNPELFVAVADDAAHTVVPYLDMEARSEHDRKHRSNTLSFLSILAAGASGAAASIPQTATVSNSNGTSSTVSYTDPNAVANANTASNARAAEAQQNINAQQKATSNTLMKRNTLHKGASVSGVVYFEGPKSMKATKKGFTPLIGMDVVLNGVTYRF